MSSVCEGEREGEREKWLSPLSCTVLTICHLTLLSFCLFSLLPIGNINKSIRYHTIPHHTTPLITAFLPFCLFLAFSCFFLPLPSGRVDVFPVLAFTYTPNFPFDCSARLPNRADVLIAQQAASSSKTRAVTGHFDHSRSLSFSLARSLSLSLATITDWQSGRCPDQPLPLEGSLVGEIVGRNHWNHWWRDRWWGS